CADDERLPDQLGDIPSLLIEVLRELRKMSAKGEGRIADIDSPWLSAVSAAKYLDYSPRQFRDVAKRYEIPRHGPSGNRYDRAELDEFMRDPTCFKISRLARIPRSLGRFQVEDSLLASITKIRKAGSIL
ncbi:MAG: hypothetical protein M1398_06120, partial [Deltaproteobacteria bacterium]|nr:hypothetical protein [Deltaproteobacteria bacterium]